MACIIEGPVPMLLNLGKPEEMIGYAYIYHLIDGRKGISIILSEEASNSLADLTSVFELNSIGFTGVKRKNTVAKNWPKFNMEINGTPRWLPLNEAGISYDSGHVSVFIIGQVLEADGSVRNITPEERRAIADRADDWSASK